jgi:hypothetical protein
MSQSPFEMSHCHKISKNHGHYKNKNLSARQAHDKRTTSARQADDKQAPSKTHKKNLLPFEQALSAKKIIALLRFFRYTLRHGKKIFIAF